MSADLDGTCLCTIRREQMGVISSATRPALTCVHAQLLVFANLYSSEQDVQQHILWLNDHSSLTCQCRSGGLIM